MLELKRSPSDHIIPVLILSTTSAFFFIDDLGKNAFLKKQHTSHSINKCRRQLNHLQHITPAHAVHYTRMTAQILSRFPYHMCSKNVLKLPFFGQKLSFLLRIKSYLILRNSTHNASNFEITFSSICKVTFFNYV